MKANQYCCSVFPKPEKIHADHAITDHILSRLVFVKYPETLPPHSDGEYGKYVSKTLYFRTKRSLFTGYYHFVEGYFYSNTLTMHGDSRWARRIENVIGWALQDTHHAVLTYVG